MVDSYLENKSSSVEYAVSILLISIPFIIFLIGWIALRYKVSMIEFSMFIMERLDNKCTNKRWFKYIDTFFTRISCWFFPCAYVAIMAPFIWYEGYNTFYPQESVPFVLTLLYMYIFLLCGSILITSILETRFRFIPILFVLASVCCSVAVIVFLFTTFKDADNIEWIKWFSFLLIVGCMQVYKIISDEYNFSKKKNN